MFKNDRLHHPQAQRLSNGIHRAPKEQHFWTRTLWIRTQPTRKQNFDTAILDPATQDAGTPGTVCQDAGSWDTAAF